MRYAAPLLAAALLAAACSTAPAASHPPVTARTAPDPSASAVPAASPDSPGLAPDVAACQAMEAYPKFTTPAQARAYVAFLGRQMVKAGTSGRLDDAIQRLRADLDAYLLGAASQARVLGDARHLQAVCTSYGVRG